MTTERFDSTERPAQTAVFATTHWSVVLTAGDTAIPGAPEALERLCRTYWYPLYAYVRRQGRGPEEAQDLTQAFFAQDRKSTRLNSSHDQISYAVFCLKKKSDATPTCYDCCQRS